MTRKQARRARHDVCKAGAAVRLHGYAPARVLYLEHERRGPDYSNGTWMAHCVITARGPDWSAGRIGGRTATGPAKPLRFARGSGRLWWPAFSVDRGP